MNNAKATRLFCLLILLVWIPAIASGQQVDWIAADGGWDVAANWSTGEVPGWEGEFATHHVTISDSSNNGITVDNASGRLVSLSLATGVTVNVADWGELTVLSQIVNQGEIVLDGENPNQSIRSTSSSQLTLTGGGTIRVDNGILGAISGKLRNLDNHIVGKLATFSGRPFNGIDFEFKNRSTIAIDAPDSSMDLFGSIDNTDGSISVGESGRLLMWDGSAIKGGTVYAGANSQVEMNGAVYFEDTTLQGLFKLGGNQNAAQTRLWLEGTIVNEGVIMYDPDNPPVGQTSLGVNPGTVLAGTGEINLNFIYGVTPVSQQPMSLVTSNHIHGAGFFDFFIDVENHGIIEANIPNSPINFLSDAHTNRGTIRATNGGVINFFDTILENEGGMLIADDLGLINPDQFMLNVNGGVIAQSGTGQVCLNGTYRDVTFMGNQELKFVTLSGHTVVHDHLSVDTLDSPSNLSVKYEGDVVFSGGGELTVYPSGGSIQDQYIDSFINVDTTLSGAIVFYTPTIEFLEDSVLAPGFETFFNWTAYFFCPLVELNGKIELDAESSAVDPTVANTWFNGFHECVRIVGEFSVVYLDGEIEINPFYGAQVGDFWDVVGAGIIQIGPNFAITNPYGLQLSYEIVEGLEDGIGSADVVRVTVEAVGPTVITPDTLTILRGVVSGGSVNELAESDDSDITVQRSDSSLQAIVEFDIEGNTINQSPSSMSFKLESSVFARGVIDLQIELFDYDTGEYEVVHMGAASRFTDSIVEVTMDTNPERFVDDASGNVKARVRYSTSNRRRQFSAGVDQAIWTLE